MKKITQALAIISLLMMFSCDELASDRAKPIDEIKEKIGVEDSTPRPETSKDSTQ